jgi:hypothetical protein
LLSLNDNNFLANIITILKPITKDAHGLIDYAYGITLPLLPEIVGFKKSSVAQNLLRGIGGVVLGYSAVTKAKWGLMRLLPFRAHLAIDLGINCAAIAAPWLLGFSGDRKARNTIIIAGVLGLAATLLTDPNTHDEKDQQYLFI